MLTILSNILGVNKRQYPIPNTIQNPLSWCVPRNKIIRALFQGYKPLVMSYIWAYQQQMEHIDHKTLFLTIARTKIA